MSTLLRLVAALCVTLIVAPALAQPNSSLYLEDMTSTELRDKIAAGATTVLVPIGGTEQNGPAMVLGKHNQRARVLAGKIAAGVGHAVVAPVIAYVPEGGVNPPTAHMRFPGTITVPDAVFEATLEYAARSFRLHGFRDIVFLGDHGGYRKSLHRVADKLNREWRAADVRVHPLDAYYTTVETDYAAALRQHGYTDAEIGTHAGVADTSLALAIDPSLVRTERLHGPKLGAAQGVYGDPSRSTAQAGQLGIDLIVAHSIAAIRQATARR